MAGHQSARLSRRRHYPRSSLVPAADCEERDHGARRAATAKARTGRPPYSHFWTSGAGVRCTRVARHSASRFTPVSPV